MACLNKSWKAFGIPAQLSGKRRATPSHIHTISTQPQRTNNLGTAGVGGLLKLQTEDLKVSERILSNILSLSPNIS